MICVLDASVALKCFVEEAGAAQARALLASDRLFLAPDLIVPEVCNAAWKKMRRGEITEQHAALIARAVPSLFERLLSCALISERAVELSALLDHPAYDCFYLAAAEREDARLITDDARLLTRLAGTDFHPLAEPLQPPG